MENIIYTSALLDDILCIRKSVALSQQFAYLIINHQAFHNFYNIYTEAIIDLIIALYACKIFIQSPKEIFPMG